MNPRARAHTRRRLESRALGIGMASTSRSAPPRSSAAPELPPELLSLLASHVGSATSLVACIAVCKAWKDAFDSNDVWRHLALARFAIIKHILNGLKMDETKAKWKALYRQHHLLATPQAHPHTPPATLKDFLFSVELTENGSLVMEWTGTLEAFDGDFGGPFCKLWKQDARPSVATRLLAQIDGDNNLSRAGVEMLKALHLRIIVSKATPDGPRSLQLYNGGDVISSFEDFVSFEYQPAPIIPAARRTFEFLRQSDVQELEAAALDLPRRLRVNPWLKLDDGHMDDLLKLFDNSDEGKVLKTQCWLTYLEHLAPWS